MAALFNTYLYQPILAVLIFIYQNISFGDLGVAIILLTVLVRIVLFPLFYKGAKDQTIAQRLQPKIKQIQVEHKENKEKQAEALMALYKEHKFNPLSGILLLLVQLPVFIALFQIFRKELGAEVFGNQMLFGLIDVGAKSIIIVIIAAGLQFLQGKLSLPPEKKGADAGANPLASAGKIMIYVGPLFTVLILMNLPAGIGIYWIVTTLISVIQQAYINAKLAKADAAVAH
jgi:YidC/Oxa1 family membrane protein insertase